jgi:hypothetical protein
MEQWKKIAGFDFYEVSDKGRARSALREIERVNPRWKSHKQTITVGGKIIDGWKRYKNGKPSCIFVSLRQDGKTYTFRLHRLVLSAFVGDAPEGMECCHNNGDPFDNRLENLRWGTHKDNMQDCVDHGRKSNPPVHMGENHPRSKLSASDVQKIRSMEYRHGLFAQIANLYNISLGHASRIWKGDGWDDKSIRSVNS